MTPKMNDLNKKKTWLAQVGLKSSTFLSMSKQAGDDSSQRRSKAQNIQAVQSKLPRQKMVPSC